MVARRVILAIALALAANQAFAVCEAINTQVTVEYRQLGVYSAVDSQEIAELTQQYSAAGLPNAETQARRTYAIAQEFRKNPYLRQDDVLRASHENLDLAHITTLRVWCVGSITEKGVGGALRNEVTPAKWPASYPEKMLVKTAK